MPKLIMRGAIVRHYDGRRSDSGPFTKIHVSADFSDPIREFMEWGDPQEGAKDSNLEGELNATHLILTPNGKELKGHELQLTAQMVEKFKFVRGKTTKEGKVKSDRLDFQIITVEAGAGAKVEQYIAVIGKGVAQLRIGYEEQTKMDLAKSEDATEDATEDEQERLISREQAEDTQDADNDEPPAKGGPTLAPAALVGGTHQKGTRGRPPRNREAERIADGTEPLPGEIVN